MSDTRYYLAMWDCHGFEYLEEITRFHPDEWAKASLFESIKQSKVAKQEGFPPIQSMLLRARFNSQRNYGIYVFTSTDDVTFEDIKAWSESDPQGLVNWIREYHTQCLLRSNPTTKSVIS
jgi:hypothetical protein